jgi:trehalose 6-phosphate phosphatase
MMSKPRGTNVEPRRARYDLRPGKAAELKPDTQRKFDSFFQTVAQSPTSLLMLDYDGTLAPFSISRDRAFPYAGVPPLLQRILARGRTRVVIVSGRDVQDMASLLKLEPCPEIWGLHGMQHRSPDGTTTMSPLSERTLDGLSDAERWLAYQQLRESAEFKTGSIAVHWRGMDERQVEELRGRVLLGWQTVAESSGLNLLEFDGGIEICSPQADKGETVRTLLQEMAAGTPAAYLGDDTTDERAFLAIQDRGLSVLVRPTWRRTKAELWLKPPEELLYFFRQWLEATAGREAAGGLTAHATAQP